MAREKLVWVAKLNSSENKDELKDMIFDTELAETQGAVENYK